MIARKSLLILLTNGVGASAGLVTLFFVGRYLDSTILGMVAFALSAVGVATFVAGLGFDFAHVKRVSEGRDLATCLTTYAYVKVGLTSAFVVVAAVAAFAWDRFIGFGGRTTLAVVLMAIAYHAFIQLRFIPQGTFNGLLETAKASALSLVEFLTRAPLVAAAALYVSATRGGAPPFAEVLRRFAETGLVPQPTDDGIRAFLVALAWAGGALASLAAGFWILVRRRYPFGAFDRSLVRSYATYAFPIAIFSVVSLLATQIDTIMVGFFWKASAAGVYYAAQRIASIVLLLPTAVTTLFFPRISELASRDDRSAVQAASLTAQRYLSLVMMVASMLLIVFPREGIHIFLGDAFLDAAPVLVVLSINAVLLSFGAVPSAILMGHDHSRAVATIGLFTVGTNIVLNALFIPSSLLGVRLLGLSALGAAMATALAQLLSTTVLTVLAARYTGHLGIDRRVAKHVAAAVIVGIGLHLLRGLPLLGGLQRVWQLVGVGIVGVAAYILILVAWRELTRSEWDLAMDAMHPGKMARYVVDEVRAPHR